MENTEKAQGALECANAMSTILSEIFSDEDGVSPNAAWEEWSARDRKRATLYVSLCEAITESFETVRDAVLKQTT